MMPLTRRAALGALLATPALAQPRTARILVGFAPGGSTDILARLVADRLRGRFAANVIVENRPGAAGRLAVEAVKGAAPDGLTTVLSPNSIMTVSPHAFPRTTRYHPVDDFHAVALVAKSALVLVLHKDHPARDMAGFLAWARAQPEVPYATPAAGTPAHFLMFDFARAQSLPLIHVSYRGANLAVQDLVAGRLPMMFSLIGDVLPHIRSGAVRALAVSSTERNPRLPDVPSFRELNLDQLSRESWWGVFAPAGVPVAVLNELHAHIAETVRNAPEFRQALETMELTADPAIGPAALQEVIRGEFAYWGEVVRAAGFNGDA